MEMLMQITPIVAADPKEVPVRSEIRQQSQKQITTIRSGRITRVDAQMMVAMAPQARHTAVSIPMSMKVIRMFFTDRMPVSDTASRRKARFPRESP